jgi:WD40 repeat protein/DNA-binding SARP family transcriptional activator
MQIRVLGPVEADVDGRPLPLAGPKQRALLALLALSANATVSLDRLIEGLWGEEPPATAPKMVQLYVSRLRKLLGTNGGEIATRGRGYELLLDPEAVDALRLERLVARASDRDELRRDELAREALALRRGPPLADVIDEPFAAGEARRLDELHLAALELVIEADIDGGRHVEVIPRLGALVDEHPLRERLRVLMMLALYRAGRQADALDVFRDARWTLVETLGIEPGPELRRVQEAILRQDETLELAVPDEAWVLGQTIRQAGAAAARVSDRRGDLRLVEQELASNVVDLATLRDSSARARGHDVCPFKGLEPFDVDDADYFFGRERLVAEMVARLPGAPLLGVVGPSGSGKSSLVRAGLVPALAGGALPGSEDWERTVIRPGAQPLETLRNALRTGSPLLLVIDQFEELFTLCRDDAQRAAFLDLLVEAVDRGNGTFTAVLAVRADFYGRCAEDPRLARLLAANTVLVGPMRADELTRAITQPASAVGLDVEDELVSALVSETVGRAGGLPLLSAALLELWRRRPGGPFTVELYGESGGVEGAVARLAESAYERLAPEERVIARNMLLRLAGAGEGEDDVRRRVPLAELDLAHGEAPRCVLQVLAESRLVTIDDETVEVAHEALLREWPRLRGWLDEHADSRRVHRHITLAAGDWAARGRDPADLYRGARLASALDFAATDGDALNDLEREFLTAARDVSEREAVRGRRMNRRLRTALAGALIALAAATTAGLVALDQRGDARNEAVVADAQRVGAQALTAEPFDYAALLARTGVKLHDSAATRGSLFSVVLGNPPALLGLLEGVGGTQIYAVAVSPDGKRVALGDATGTVRMFDAATRRRLGSYRLRSTGLVQELEFSPDGALLAITGHERQDRSQRVAVHVLDVRTMARRQRVVPPLVPGAPFVVAHVAWDADSHGLVVIQTPLFPDGPPSVIRRIDLSAGRVVGDRLRIGSHPAMRLFPAADRRTVLVTSPGDDATYVVDTARLRVVERYDVGDQAGALAPDNRTFALGSEDGSVRLLDLQSRAVRRMDGRHKSEIETMRFAPDGRTLVTSSEDGELLVWDVARGRIRERFTAHRGDVWGIAIAPDGRTVYSAGTDGRVLLWDLTGRRRLLTTFALPQGFDVSDPTPRGLAERPDGSDLVVTEADGSLRLIDAKTLRTTARTDVLDGPALAAAFSPDGRLLVVTGDRGRVALLDARTLGRVAVLRGLSSWTQAAAFSPDGRLLAVGDTNSDASKLRVWDVRRRVMTRFRAKSSASAITFSPNGRLLAAALIEGGAAEVRDVRDGHLVKRLHARNIARSVAFSPDGRLLFVGQFNGAGQLFSTGDWRPVGPEMRGQNQRLTSAEFAPSGRELLTASADGTVMLWDVRTRKPIGRPVTVESDTFVSATISRDGRYVFAASIGTRGIRLAISPSAWKRHACTLAGRELTRGEWHDALPREPYQRVCTA